MRKSIDVILRQPRGWQAHRFIEPTRMAHSVLVKGQVEHRQDLNVYVVTFPMGNAEEGGLFVSFDVPASQHVTFPEWALVHGIEVAMVWYAQTTLMRQLIASVQAG